MALRVRLATQSGRIAQPTPIQVREGKITADAVASINGFQALLVTALNGLISLGDGTQSAWAGNIDGQLIEYTFALADTEYEIPHGLGRVPWGTFIAAQDRAGSIYTSSRGSWSNEKLMLKASAANMVVLMLVV